MLPHLRCSWVCDLSVGADWNRFRGPNGSGITEVTGRPAVFGHDQNRIGKTSLPPGHSSPILSRDRVFLMAAVHRDSHGRLQIIAPSSRRMESYDPSTGEVLWHVAGLPGEMNSQPIVDGSSIFVNGYASPDKKAGNMRPVPTFEEGLVAEDTNRDGFIAKAEAHDARAQSAWQFIDLNTDGKLELDREEWEKYRALMSAENALLA